MRVSFFATCLVDMFFPEVGLSAVALLEQHGARVDFPMAQTCCGQPAWNSGYKDETKAMALQYLKAFTDSEYIVTPSGSCAAMVRGFYPELFADQPTLQKEAEAVAARTYELSEFLVRVMGLRDLGAAFQGKVAYHASCHMTRELGVKQEPLQLLKRVKGVELCELERPDLCCGFGGSFAVRNSDTSVAMADDKLADVKASGAEVLVACDMGCLLHLGGRLRRRGDGLRVMHLAEVLVRKEDA